MRIRPLATVLKPINGAPRARAATIAQAISLPMMTDIEEFRRTVAAPKVLSQRAFEFQRPERLSQSSEISVQIGCLQFECSRSSVGQREPAEKFVVRRSSSDPETSSQSARPFLVAQKALKIAHHKKKEVSDDMLNLQLLSPGPNADEAWRDIFDKLDGM